MQLGSVSSYLDIRALTFLNQDLVQVYFQNSCVYQTIKFNNKNNKRLANVQINQYNQQFTITSIYPLMRNESKGISPSGKEEGG